MYQNESIDSYIRSILGYPSMEMNNTSMSQNMDYMMDSRQNMNMDYLTSQNSELEECYPEIYKIVYPMVAKRCSNITGPITNELIEDMTREIYEAVEGDNGIQININLQNEVQNTNMNRAGGNTETTSKNQTNTTRATNLKKETIQSNENKQENRQFRNSSLQDLIKILIIRELLRGNRPNRPPNRPPMPGPGRPPMGPGNRPPIMPRGYESGLYEIW